MTIFGVDVSHHQPVLNFFALREEGVEFAFIKSSEGDRFTDNEFNESLHRARVAGLLTAAYHYVRSDATAAAQVALIERLVPLNVPVLLDVEANSGTLPRVRDLIYLLREAGYRVPLLYLPRWYWQQLGSPSLAGLPPLWSSRYPDTTVDDLNDEWARVPAHYWNGYGGLDVAVLQFTSSARIAGYAPLDANAFRGTRDELAKLLGYQERKNVNQLILAQLKDSDEVWVGDGLRRRQVADVTELGGLQHWIALRGGDATLHTGWDDVRVLGQPIVVADVDEVALATELQARGVVGATREDVYEVVQAIFRDAGSDAE